MTYDPRRVNPQLKESHRRFANRRRAQLVQLGFSPEGAQEILRAAGPSVCVAAVIWAAESYRAFVAVDPDTPQAHMAETLALLADARDVTQTRRTLNRMGYPEVPYDKDYVVLRILRGASKALEIGLPEPE